jgi:hypothetical protein
MKNGKFRDTGNIGCTRHRRKTNKTNNTTQKTKKMSNTDTIKNGFLLLGAKDILLG